MKSGAKSSLSALLLCSGLCLSASAFASHEHFHNVAPAAGHAAHETGHAPGPMPGPRGGGYWRGIPPAAPHGAYFAGGRPGHFVHYWGHGDIRYFHQRDFIAWNGGFWRHSWYGGRFGWWWVVSGVWFFYPVPVYPYPDPYVPSTFIAPPPPPDDDAPAPAATDQFWYFCPASNAYYPYVPACPTGWQQVPANSNPQSQQPEQPDPSQQPPPPAAPPPPGG